MALLRVLVLLIIYETMIVTSMPKSGGSKRSTGAMGTSVKPRRGGRCLASVLQLQDKMADMQEAVHEQDQRQKKYSGLALMLVSHVFVPALLLVVLTLSIFSMAVQQSIFSMAARQPYNEYEDLPPSYEEAMELERED